MGSEAEPGAGEFVRSAVEEDVAILTIDHPPVNFLDRQTLRELDAAVGAAAADPQTKVIIITGAGQTIFSAGVDIKEVVGLRSGGDAEAAAREGQAIFGRIERCPKPVIAAINGTCLGGGNELAMACHLRVASERARFGQTESNLGLMPGWGGTQRLARLVGKSKALEIALTADQVPASEALRIGLVNKVVPDGEVLKSARDLARRITGKSQVAVRLIMEAVAEGQEVPLEDGLALEARKFALAFQSEDAREGVAAFFEKRQPRFKDR